MKTFETLLNESRPTRISELFSELDKHKSFNLIDFHGTFDGMVALFRYKDGNAYELKIKPAEKSSEFKQTKGK